jgi:hypothetical protein
MNKWIVIAGIAASLALAAADAVAGARQVSTAPRPKPNSIDISYVEPKLLNNQPVYMVKRRKRHGLLRVP